MKKNHLKHCKNPCIQNRILHKPKTVLPEMYLQNLLLLLKFPPYKCFHSFIFGQAKYIV